MALAFGAGAAWAEEKKSGEWEYELAPLYLWGISIDGSTRVGPVTTPLDVKFKDSVSDLSGVFTFHFEGKNPRWGYYVDFSYVKLTPKSQLPTGQTVFVDFRNPLIEGAGLYRLGEAGRSPWWLVGGLRYMRMDIDVTGIPSPPLPFSAVSVKEDITDAFLGARYQNKLSQRWDFMGQADIGTGTSDLVWSATLLFNYRFTKTVGAYVGWRWLDYDVDKSDFGYDATMSGPLLAVNFRW
ncbi:MAG: hypothetical protein AMJ63_13380 [Myxococcales bacterium SG8_38_1]|nr:MAG: hypothetical protein AMJ63_13380 [Myxococcales bacterium SG8_38_1]